MNCFDCGAPASAVLETRVDGQLVERRRRCSCGAKWTTTERLKRITAYGSIGPPKDLLHMGNGATTSTSHLPQVISGSDPGSVLSPDRISNPDPDARAKSNDQAKAALLKRNSDVFPRALSAFCNAWRAVYGVEYRPTGKDRNQLGRTLNEIGADLLPELPAIFARYLQDRSPFVAQEQRHSLAYFCTSGGVNKYRARPVVVSRTEAAGLAAVEAFNARRGNSAGE